VTLVVSPPNTASAISGSVASNYVSVLPIVLPLAAGATYRLEILYTVNHFGSATMYRSDDMWTAWETVSASFSSSRSTGTIVTGRGGTYVIQTQTNWGAVIGITLGVMTVIAIVVVVLYRKYRKPLSSTEKMVGKEIQISMTSTGPVAARAAKGGTATVVRLGPTIK